MTIKSNHSFTWKFVLIGVMTLLLLIPLEMVKGLIRERKDSANESVYAVSSSWGNAQTLNGPKIKITYVETEKDASGAAVKTPVTDLVYPEDLKIDIDAATQLLHRSIYDVMVYSSDIVLKGSFLIPDLYAGREILSGLSMGVSDLRGIEGIAAFKIGDREGAFSEGKSGIMEETITLPDNLRDGKTSVPFEIKLRVKGSQSLKIKPIGGITEVTMHSDCPDPSFTGDFLPASREITAEGFTARWVVSRINRGAPEESTFGVDLLQPLTQYQQTTRTAKYGILIILLVFIAGLAVELVGKKEIHLVQYLIIGLSLILFYALVLSFSEFMSFGKAYALSAVMTTSALTLYFRGILKNKVAWALGALIALAYVVCYILLQTKTYALLMGTLLLFVVLSIIMYFTRNIQQTNSDNKE